MIAKLKTLTNLRVVRDEKSATAWKLEVSDNLYLCVVARCRGQARVRGEQNSVECLSESDISRVVGGYVMAHLPDASQEKIVGIPLNREVEEILEGLRSARRS